MMDDDYSWWKVEYENVSTDTMHYHYIRAKNVSIGSDGEFLILDGAYFYLSWNASILDISKITVGDPELFDHVTYYIQEKLLFQLNDNRTRKAFEDYFCGLVRCDESLNTPEIIDKNGIRFEYNGSVYEYSSKGIIGVN